MDNILALHRELERGVYKHGGYKHFRISDPKPRDIHKAAVRDRLLHHALYRQLYPFFDRTFIADSYSCRKGKGTHRAMNRFRQFAYKVSQNHTRTSWVLKCDIRKFFASIDQSILIDLVGRYIPTKRITALIAEVVTSFRTDDISRRRLDIRLDIRKGLPLGNLTSQLLVNIYMNEFDQYVKHTLKAKYYIRYSDDFVILSHDKKYVESLLPYMVTFLRERLRLEMHSDPASPKATKGHSKVFITTLASGVDFLGWVHFPDHRVLRTATKRRMLKRLSKNPAQAARESYRGMLGHGNAKKVLSTIAIQKNGV